MSCSDALPASSLPGGLKIETDAACVSRSCHVDGSGNDLHRVTVRSRSLLPYEVEIEGQCQTADVEYDGLGPTWTPVMLTVPGRGGRSETVLSREHALVTLTAGRNPTILTDVKFGAVNHGKMPGTLVIAVTTT